MAAKKILIVAGEPSGDLHASNLARDLKALKPDIEFYGIGGNLLRQAGVEIVFDITKLALVGAVEVVKNLFSVKKAYDSVMRKIDAEGADLAILVDYPGFNLRLAGELKKREIPIVYYISPQVWAWGADRINLIKSRVRKMVVLFKFEEELYKRHGIDVEFVGHPLLDTVKPSVAKNEVLRVYDLSPGKPVIALLPGSRRSEIDSLLGVMLESAALIDKSLGGAQFIIAKHPDLDIKLYEKAISGSKLDVRIANGDTYNIVGAADFAIVASGTATLETAIIGTPLVLIYRASLITYILYKIVATIKFLGIVNIIAGKEVVPELLQYNATPVHISAAVVGLMNDPAKIYAMRRSLAEIKAVLGSPGASLRAANAVLPLLK